MANSWNDTWLLLGMWPELAVLLLKYCYSPSGFTNSEPSPSLSDVHSVVSLKVMGQDHSLRSSTQKEPEEEPVEHHLVP